MSSCISGTGKVFVLYEFGYGVSAHRSEKIVGRSRKQGTRKVARELGFYLDDWDISENELALSELEVDFVDRPEIRFRAPCWYLGYIQQALLMWIVLESEQKVLERCLQLDWLQLNLMKHKEAPLLKNRTRREGEQRWWRKRAL